MARTLLVSAQQAGAYPTIRDALEVAPPGSTVSIAAGEYLEAVAVEGTWRSRWPRPPRPAR